MSYEVLIVVLVVVALAIFMLLLLLDFPIPGLGSSSKSQQMSSIVSAQRSAQGDVKTKNKDDDEPEQIKPSSSSLTLEKKLKYAQWNLPPMVFYISQAVISIIAFYLVSLKFNRVLTGMALFTGPIFVRGFLNFAINRRFKAFDRDYAAFLVSLVSLLKTGMETLAALDAAAKGLEEGSLVKEEVFLMLDRLRFGVSEEKSIGAFGEDIYHTEIELFVQALLLSRRVGGSLSDTLDRLAKSVRKRQRFRAEAEGAVAMQKGSIYFILGIMVAMEIYMYFMYPAAVVDAVKDETGWQVWQVGITFILLGLVWISQVTKIKI